MAIRKSTSLRRKIRLLRKERITRKLNTKANGKNRLLVYRSNRFLYAQVIDDHKGHTLVQANTSEKEFEKLKSRKGLEAATALGKVLGERVKSKQVSNILFDRNGYNYHGRIKAIADGARETGLQF